MEIVLQLRKPRRAARVLAVFALVAQRKANVHEFDEISVASRVTAHAVDDLKELLTAGHFLVEHDEQRLAGPSALAHPTVCSRRPNPRTYRVRSGQPEHPPPAPLHD